jgi:3-isopropylmalate/(R)-2-methylmalate dehydratase small subunit
MEPIRRFTSKSVVIPIDNIDTDQIIPARFLTVTTKEGLGDHLFADWRRDGTGRDKPEFALNRPEAEGAAILVAGDNFGCGSSREHAPWALVDYGIRAVVSTSIADIFKNNALKNGLLPIEIEPAFHQKLLDQPGANLTIDLERKTLTLPDSGSVAFPIEPFARLCLMEGTDPLDFLLQQLPSIEAFESENRSI